MTHIELQNKLKAKLDLANVEFTKVVNYIKENISMFESMNLKLYYAAVMDFSKYPLCQKYQEKYKDFDLFQDFCNINYNMVIKVLKENHNIDFQEMQKHIGRASSFCLYDFYATYNGKLQIDEMIYNFYNRYIDCNDFQDLTINDNLQLEIEFQTYDIENNYSYDEEDMEEISISLDYFIEDFYNDFINHCKDIEIVYNEIKSFKDNQVEHFEDYLQNFEEELEEEVPINTITIVCSNKEYNFTIVDTLYSMELNTQIYKALNVIEYIYKNVTSKEFKETLFIEDVLHVFYEHKITLKHTPKNFKFEV
jgi:hypothetical protein